MILQAELKKVVSILIILCGYTVVSQQVADSSLVPKIDDPNYSIGSGPTVYIDELHHNFHTKDGRFKPFSDLLYNNGYTVKALSNYDQLKASDILVISNAVHPDNASNWTRPIFNAFTADEIDLLKQWVNKGGRLFIIADHMPFSGATNSLANAFGFDFCDGFARLSEPDNQPDIFSKKNNRLAKSPITDGSVGKSLQSITTFTGSSFQMPPNATAVLQFKAGDYCLAPNVAWQFNEETPSSDLEGSYQGAIMNFGKGKLAVFGEAAQFTAQVVANQDRTFRVGFNSEDAPHNIDFIRNLMLWLSSTN